MSPALRHRLTRGIEAAVLRHIAHRSFRRGVLRFALMGCRRKDATSPRPGAVPTASVGHVDSSHGFLGIAHLAGTHAHHMPATTKRSVYSSASGSSIRRSGTSTCMPTLSSILTAPRARPEGSHVSWSPFLLEQIGQGACANLPSGRFGQEPCRKPARIELQAHIGDQSARDGLPASRSFLDAK